MRQGWVLVPKIFSTCIEWVMRETVGKTDCGLSMGEARVTDLDFSDVIVIFVETLQVLVHTLDTLSMKSEPLALKLSQNKD